MEKLVSIEAVALQLGVSTRTVARMIVRGDIPAPVRISAGRRGFPQSEIDRYIAARISERDQR